MPRTRAQTLKVDPVLDANPFLRCRTYNHSWDEFFPVDMGPPPFGWRLSLRCVRCATERHDLIDRKGSVMTRRYIYPEGYQTPKEEKLDRSAYRQLTFTRIQQRLADIQAIAIGMEIS